MRHYYSSVAVENTLNNFDTERRCDLLNEVLETIEALFALKITHGNIKPSNIFLCEDGHFYLSDACKNMLYIDKDGCKITNISTFEYSSPELLKGESYDIESDVWSFGCLLYYMFSGISPFTDDSIDEVKTHVMNVEYDDLDCDSTGDLTQLLHKILNPNPKERLTPEQLKNEFESIY